MPYKRKGRKKPWISQVRVDGRNLPERSFATKKAAKEWEAKQKEAAILLTPTTSLSEWAVKYLDHSRERFVEKTYLEKRFVFQLFFEKANGELQTGRFTVKMALDHLSRQAQKRGGNAANKDRKNLVAAWNWGIKYLAMPQVNPFLQVERFPEERLVRHMPTEDDFWKAYDAAYGQDKIMLLTYLHTAARRGELFRLRWDDVDFAGSRVRLFWRKNRQGTWKSAWLPMTDDLFNALLEHKKERADNVLVFPNPDTGGPFTARLHYMDRLCKRAGVRKFGFHGIRHLTASVLAQKGVPLVDIQVILRHENLTTTQGYIRKITSPREAVEFMPSRNKKPAKSRHKIVSIKSAGVSS